MPPQRMLQTPFDAGGEKLRKVATARVHDPGRLVWQVKKFSELWAVAVAYKRAPLPGKPARGGVIDCFVNSMANAETAQSRRFPAPAAAGCRGKSAS